MHDKYFKHILKYLKGTAMQGLILNIDLEKSIECYFDTNFFGVWNQDKGLHPGLFLSITGYVIMYKNYLFIWASLIQTEITLSTTEAEYISLS